MNVLITIAGIILVIGLFNFFIFIHELGHFLAAKWRGLKIDRFQIWFGKPIWSKEIDGVLYGLGTIPAGGFVALPQMVTMESVEGANREGNDQLPPITPLDKIIVAAAGPAFSLGLAVVASFFIWWVGKPKDIVHSTEVGYVEAGSPAAQANLKVGDHILQINGKKVNGFLGTLESVHESIMLSEGEEIEFLVERPGETNPITLTSHYVIPKSKWYQRTSMRSVGIEFKSSTIVEKLAERAENSPESPAERAGLQPGDQIVSVDGAPLHHYYQFTDTVNESANQELRLGIIRHDKPMDVFITPLVPETRKDGKAQVGIYFAYPPPELSRELHHPNPFTQVKDGLEMMWVTITKVISPRSSIKPEHLSGPVGIAKVMYDLLLTEDGWRRLLSFVVILNVNLAVLNMLPLPILDGGHIVLASGEWLTGRPVRVKILEFVQTGFAIVLLCFFLFITSRDIGDNLPGRKKEASELIWPT